MKTINSINIGIKWAVVAALISGVAVFANALVVKGIDPIVHTTVKNTMVGLMVVGVMMMSRERKAILTLTKKQWLKLIGIAVIGGSVSFALFFTGLKQIGASEGQIVNKTLVIWVMLLSIPLLKEKVTKPMILGVVLVYASSLVGGGWKATELLIGHLLVLAATLLWAIETILVKKTLLDVPVNLAVGARMGIGSLILIGLLFVTNKAPLLMKLSLTQWGLLLIVAMIMFGYVMSWYRALKYAPAIMVSSIMAGAVVITTVLAAMFTTHEFTLVNLAQAALIVAGCLLVIGGASVSFRLPRMVVKTHEG